MSEVSIIIPVFNRASVLPRALASVVAQTFTGWELIVIDDGSTDETEQVFNDWRASFHGPQIIQYIKTENFGVSHARNHGAALSAAPWLAFLDSDDEWLPRKLELQMPLTTEFPLVHGEEIWVRNGVRVNPMRKHEKSGGRIFSRCVELCCISPSTAVVKRDLFESLGGFREDFPVCEDYELWLRICSRFAVGFCDEPVIIKYGGHDDQLSRKYPAMDYYRVKALLPFLTDENLTGTDRALVRFDILRRSDILLTGYAKHGHLDRHAEVTGILNSADLI